MIYVQFGSLYIYYINLAKAFCLTHDVCTFYIPAHKHFCFWKKCFVHFTLHTHTYIQSHRDWNVLNWADWVYFSLSYSFFFALIGSNIYGCHLGYSRNTHRNTFTEFASQIVQHFGSEQGDDRKNFFTANDDIRYSCTHFYSRVCFVCHHLMYSILFIV